MGAIQAILYVFTLAVLMVALHEPMGKGIYGLAYGGFMLLSLPFRAIWLLFSLIGDILDGKLVLPPIG